MNFFYTNNPGYQAPKPASYNNPTETTSRWTRIQERITPYIVYIQAKLGCIRPQPNNNSMRNPPNNRVRLADSEIDLLISKIYQDHRLSSEELHLIEAIPFDMMSDSREFVCMLSNKVQQHSRNLYENNFKNRNNQNIDIEMDEYNSLLMSLGKIQCEFIERDFNDSLK